LHNLTIISKPDAARRWEAVLLSRLHALGHTVTVRHTAPAAPTKRHGLDRVLAIESRRFGPSLADLTAPLPPENLGTADLVIDLSGTVAKTDTPLLTLEISGHNDIAEGITEMLARRQLPELVTRLDGVPVGYARPMMIDNLWLSRLSNNLLAAAISLVLQTVTRFLAGRLQPIAAPAVPERSGGGFFWHYAPFVAAMLADRIARKIRRGKRPFYWQVAYRRIAEAGIVETGRLDGPPFAVLPDDGRRFYADPFILARDGRYYLFVEEFPYASGRGVISVAVLDADGRFEVPRVVLEEPHHLSYPQVFEADGEIFMIPESSAARELVLYLADAFPDRWLRDTVLLADIDINDATLLQSGDRYWLFGTEKDGQGSASDTMVVYSAPALRGPWRPHALNPIAIDRAAARPGGAFIRRDGRLFLPVQDGTYAYGGGLGLMELLRLDDEDVAFGPPGPISPGDAWARNGIHTLNRAGSIEVVDSAG
jgi:hypothetical protein